MDRVLIIDSISVVINLSFVIKLELKIRYHFDGVMGYFVPDFSHNLHLKKTLVCPVAKISRWDQSFVHCKVKCIYCSLVVTLYEIKCLACNKTLSKYWLNE